MSSHYKVIARKYRPQSFREIVGQDAIVTTLKNAIRRNILAHAYLFCGARGTGKTTTARVFAKALNCQNPTTDFEPCNQCSSCKEITAGNSLDVLEIDGASHRGIDDIRQINETVGYATASGKYKIYIIDEVHMLTKEAFNALLKTLEEPPPKVKFFFATTEAHKVLPTILSRCQRFNLSRISINDIISKLRQIAQELGVSVEEEALILLSNRADGSLRDAESLLDQILTFHEGALTVEAVTSVLGLMPRDSLFTLDRAGKEGNLSIAFEIANRVFTEGKDVSFFIDGLIDHIRNILLVQMSGKSAPFLSLTDVERNKYEVSAKLYRQDQCLNILEFLTEAKVQNRFSASSRVTLEAVLLRILRSHQSLPVSMLVQRLAELEQRVAGTPATQAMSATLQSVQTHMPAAPSMQHAGHETVVSSPLSQPLPLPPQQPRPARVAESSMTEDPMPTKADLGIREKKQPIQKESAPVELGARPTEEARTATVQQQSRYDTLLQFASVELEGTIRKR